MNEKRSDNAKQGILTAMTPILIGSGIGVVVILLLLVLFSLILTISDFGSGVLMPMSTVCVGFGALAAGFAASKINGKNGFITGMMSGAVLYVLFLLISLIVSGGAISMVSFFRLIIMLVCSAIGGILGINLKRKKKYV